MAGMGGKTTRYNVRLAGRKGVEVYQPEDFEWAFDTLHGWMQDLAEQTDPRSLQPIAVIAVAGDGTSAAAGPYIQTGSGPNH